MSSDDRSIEDVEELGYAGALAELEAILAELEADHVDVDLLAQRVRRAAALIELCRSRIEAARMEVTRILSSDDAENEAEN